MKLRKAIGRAALGAFAVSVIPYRVKKDEGTGTLEIRSLLWGVRKTPAKEGEKKDRYEIAIPGSGLDLAAAKEAETAGEETAAEA